MKHFALLDKVDTQITRLGELNKLFAVISNGAEHSSQEEITSAIQYVEGSLEDIYLQLQIGFQNLHSAIGMEK